MALFVELGREFHQPPWVFENAPFHWYRPLREWFFWYQRKVAAASGTQEWDA